MYQLHIKSILECYRHSSYGHILKESIFKKLKVLVIYLSEEGNVLWKETEVEEKVQQYYPAGSSTA